MCRYTTPKPRQKGVITAARIRVPGTATQTLPADISHTLAQILKAQLQHNTVGKGPRQVLSSIDIVTSILHSCKGNLTEDTQFPRAHIDFTLKPDPDHALKQSHVDVQVILFASRYRNQYSFFDPAGGHRHPQAPERRAEGEPTEAGGGHEGMPPLFDLNKKTTCSGFDPAAC